MRIFIIGLSLFASTSALAQQQQTPSEQALGTKLMQEIQGGLNCSANLISVQADLTKTQTDLAKANVRIKELEPKPEEKK